MPYKFLHQSKLICNSKSKTFSIKTITTTTVIMRALKLKKLMNSYPEPLPPTNAIFFPAGTVKLNFDKMGWPFTYWKPTFSKITSASLADICAGGTFDSYETKEIWVR